MKSEVSGTSSQQYLENVTMDEIDVDYCLRNVSVQTGEEFSPQFLQNLTYKRKIRATGESSQELLNDCGVPKTIVQSVKEYREIPSGNVIDQYQQTRVEMQSNQNEKLVYEYQAGSTRGLQVEAEKVAYSDATTNYRHQDYTITGYHQNPQQTSTYNVQAGLHAYNRVSEVPDGPFSEKMKFLCSFGGRILTRPSDGKLRYLGGETRIISIKKNLNYQELVMRTYAICNQPHIIKYQLPGEDLDSLISVCSDDDFHHMIDEYQELEKGCQRLRIFLETLNERKSSCSSEASSGDLTDNALKYVVAVNGIPEPILQKSSSRESGSPVDSMTSFQIPPKLTTKLPNSEQFIQTASNTKTSYLLTPSITMPVQYKKETNTQLIVGGDGDQVDQQAHESSYHVNHNLNNIEFGTYQQTFENHPVLGLYGQSNVDFKKPMINESAIESEKFVLTHKQSRNTIKEKTETSKCESPPIILNTDVSKQYNEWDQDLIRFTENKNSLNLGFDLDTEDCHQIVSPATPLERQYSIATTVSSDTQNNTSLEPSRIDVNAENPFLLTSSAENEHIVHDLLIPDSTIFVPICSDVSLGESSIDNLGDMSLSQTSDEKNAEDMPNFLPLDLLLSTIDFQCIQDKTIDKVLTRSYTENESVAHSHSEDVEDDKKMMDRPISDATMAEIQAGIHGLQTIRNDDLEELSEIGCGTFGTVYHGKWRGTDVAIKRIKESCFLGKPTEQDRLMKDFWREAQILSQLHHPNVVALYGVVRDGPGGTLSTVTEFMANGSLRHVLSKKNRSLDQRKKLMMAQDAAIGMEYLHLKNIVHFDLKCDNLLVNLGDPERPKCKVADFGLSRMKRDSLVSGGARGTLPWIAPELLDGSSSRVCEKVDVFSFGIVMWEILTGEEPYADMHCGAIIGGIVTNTLRPPIPRSCDHGWKKLMEECWSNDPGDRPSFTEITNKFQAMSAELQSKTQKRVVRDAYNHNHLRNQPRIL